MYGSYFLLSDVLSWSSELSIDLRYYFISIYKGLFLAFFALPANLFLPAPKIWI